MPAPAHAEIDFLFARIIEFRARLVRVIPPQVRTIKRFIDVASGCADVVARAEMLARAAQHDHAYGIVINGAPERVIERIRHLRILCIVEAGPVHRDRGDTILRRIQHRLFGFIDRRVVTLDKLVGRIDFAHDVPFNRAQWRASHADRGAATARFAARSAPAFAAHGPARTRQSRSLPEPARP